MAKQPQDDLFEGGTMSFGEHLEELRVCLFRSIIGIVIGCLIGLYAAEKVVLFFEGPLERALTSHYLTRALEGIKKDLAGPVPDEYRETILVSKLVPEKMSVEPAQIAQVLGVEMPAVLGEQKISPNSFIAQDFKSPAAAEQFAQELVKAGAEKNASPAKRLWESLTEEQQQQLKTFSQIDSSLEGIKKAEGGVKPSAEELAALQEDLKRSGRSQLLAALNVVLSKAELHKSPEFKNLSGAHAAAVASLREKNGDTQRLNKLLIAGTFSDTFRTPQVNLVSFYNWKPVKVRFQVLNAQEAFMIYLKAALLTGVVIAAPWIFYNIWNFVAAGLYPHEKNQVFLYLPISLILFFAGAALAFTFVFEPVLNFLFQFNTGLNAEFDPRIGEWLSFVLILPLGFGISFQLPLVMLFVNRLGLVTVETYMQQWRMAILIIFVVAMVLTPADPVSMLLMAIPLCGLYVLGIAMCLWMPRSRSPFDQAYEPSA